MTPREERRRLAALRAYDIVDTLPEREFENCVRLAASIAGTEAAALTFLDSERQWVKAQTGLWFSHLAREAALSAEVVANGELVLEDAAADPAYRDHPGVTGLDVRCFAAWPVTAPDGSCLGALIVADRAPRTLDESRRAALGLVARQVEHLLEQRRTLRSSSVLAAVAAAANTAGDFRHAVGSALGVLCERGGWTAGAAYALDSRGTGIVPVRTWHSGGLRPTAECAERPFDVTGLPQLVLSSGMAAWLDGGDAAPRIPGDVVSAYAFPILVGDEVVGVIELVTDEARPPAAELTELLGQAGVALGRVVERERARSHVERREERLRQLLELAGDAFVSTDAAGVITGWNRRAEELLGWSAQEAVGTAMSSLLVPEHLRAAHEAGMARYVSTRIPTILGRPLELPALTRDGRELPVELVLWATDHGDGLELNAFLRDISHRKEAERLLRADLEGKERLVERLQELDRIKAEFIATVSHEFRTPLTSILGYLEMLTEGLEAEDARHALAAMTRGTHRLRGLVDNLLTLSRIDSSALGHQREAVRLAEVAEQTVRSVVPLALQRGIAISTDLAPDGALDAVVMADPDQLELAVANLLSNAVKFTLSGGSIDVRVHAVDGTAVLTVTDTGVGIDEHEQASLFTPFFRTRSAEQDAVQGTGLGLAVVRGILDAHGGSVQLASTPGVGTSVQLRLPLAGDAEWAGAAAS
ncbi:ATP-binding protein [Motilibacter deserti]|uniref:Sensor-like histidine kinase SenX3 n=1 Tax=Motilibacter deserti TaxID=2714956 RepID=A0ABX0H2E3_9ACTN|nr:ATP-binding protein [Motilibacter deserti]NHC15974.1 PAS domain S-box protein [Motilibacter deserti]